jgi:DNA-binding GntR family transcriptional regulator
MGTPSSLKTTGMERRCLRDSIRDTIAHRIIEGRYAPGERLLELRLAEEFKVSQSPVREALRELEAVGLVETKRYCGTRVRAPQAVELSESYQLRAILEERAARMAVPLSPTALGQMEACLEGMKQCARQNDAEAYIRQAVEFHRIILESCGNRLFLQTWNLMMVDVRAQIAISLMVPELSRFVEVHEAILAAFKAQDGALAGERLRTMMEDLIRRLEQGTPRA